MRQVHAAYRKESSVEQGKIRRPVNSRLRYEKRILPMVSDIPSVQQTLYHKAHGMLREARMHKRGGYKTILERWHDDDKYRTSLSDIGRTEEQIIQYDAIALEDHSYVTTWQERSRNDKSWNISLNKEGIPVYTDTFILHHMFSCTVVAQTCFYLLSQCTVTH